MRLAGKRAILVGVSSTEGMGAAVAARMVAEGARVVIAARDAGRTAAAAEQLGVEWTTIDLLDEPSIARGMNAAREKLAGLDIAVNLVGQNQAALLADETADGLLHQARLHFVGTALFIRDAAAAMSGPGSIVTISSLTVELTGARLAAYAGSKAAADKVVRVAALEYGDRGIRVNSVAPGLTRTAMTGAYFDNPAIIGAFRRETPLGNTADVTDVANAVVWVASDECIATGDLIRVSAGAHLRRLPTPADFIA